jgi:ribosome biogenesis GTPase
MDTAAPTLAELGWTPFFSAQMSAHEDGELRPARVMSVHRGMISILGGGLDGMIASNLPGTPGPEDRPTVGDWVLVDRDGEALVRILERKNLFKRPAPGDDRRTQLIAANVDTLFIVTSCNQDFSAARTERYLVLAREVGVEPVVVLTKADLAETPETFVEIARALQPGLQIEVINGRDPASVAKLAVRCGKGQTVTLVGSSGVGKSTLINTLRGSDSIATQAVREADGKGRHTTTVREMHRLGRGADGGGWLVDTPGMRELQLADAATGLAEVFDDVEALALQCRFTNCTHAGEPGCAIRTAIDQGVLQTERLERWRRLTLEEIANTGRMTRSSQDAGKPRSRKNR